MNRLLKPRFQCQGRLSGHQSLPVPSNLRGVGVDIRSDLYSLGVTLWEMVTGQAPFRGPPAEVMYQHQHAPLPRRTTQRCSTAGRRST